MKRGDKKGKEGYDREMEITRGGQERRENGDRRRRKNRQGRTGIKWKNEE